MRIYKSFSDLGKAINKESWEVQKAYEKWIGRNYMYVGDTEVKMHVKDDELHFVLVDENDDKDCNDYMMTYEIEGYLWKVYVDDIEGWQECKVISMTNTKMAIDRVTVICPSGTQLNRRAEFALFEDEVEANGCVYYIEK